MIIQQQILPAVLFTSSESSICSPPQNSRDTKLHFLRFKGSRVETHNYAHKTIPQSPAGWFKELSVTTGMFYCHVGAVPDRMSLQGQGTDVHALH